MMLLISLFPCRKHFIGKREDNETFDYHSEKADFQNSGWFLVSGELSPLIYPIYYLEVRIFCLLKKGLRIANNYGTIPQDPLDEESPKFFFGLFEDCNTYWQHAFAPMFLYFD